MTALKNILIWILTQFKLSAQERASRLSRQRTPTRIQVRNPLEVALSIFQQMWNLLAGGLLYGFGLAFGFIALMAMSWNQGFRLNIAEMGTLQFLSAGIIPAALIFVGWVVFRVVSELPRWTRTKLSPVPRAWLVMLLDILFSTGLLVAGAAALLAIVFTADNSIGPVLGLSAVLTMSSLILRVFVTDQDIAARIFYRAYVGGGVLTLAFLVLFLYPFAILPRLPQEFGGSRPKCVRVDLEISSLTKDTLLAIGYKPKASETSPEVEGIDLEQLFSSDDNLFVLTPADGTLAQRQIVKLSKSLVHSSRASYGCST